MSRYEIISLILQSIIGVGAVTFGYLQYRINSRMQSMQEFVALTVDVQHDKSINVTKLYFENSGKQNIYIHKLYMPGNSIGFKVGRLVATGDKGSSYWMLAPGSSTVGYDKEFKMSAYIKDESGNKYKAEFGGIYNEVVIGQPNVKADYLSVWALKTYRKEWNF